MIIASHSSVPGVYQKFQIKTNLFLILPRTTVSKLKYFEYSLKRFPKELYYKMNFLKIGVEI